MQTTAIIIAIFMAAWAVRGNIADNTVAIAEMRTAIEHNTAAITEMRTAITQNAAAIAEMRIIIADMRNDISEIRGALLVHIGRHDHAPTVALQDPKAETQ